MDHDSEQRSSMMPLILLEAGQVFDLASAPARAASSTQFVPYVLAVGGIIAVVAAYFVVREQRRQKEEPALSTGEGDGSVSLTPNQKQKLERADRAGDHVAAGDLLEKAGRHAEAAEQYARAEAWRQAADAFHAADRHVEAIHYFKKAGDRRRAAKMYAEQGKNRAAAAEFVEAGEQELAAKYYQKADDHGRAAAHFANTGQFLEAARNYERGDIPAKAARHYAREFMRALKQADGNTDEMGPSLQYARKAGEFYREVGNDSKAAEVFRRADMHERAARSFEEAGEAKRAADLLMKVGEVDGAVSLLQEAGETERAHRAQGELAYESGEYREAAEAFEEAGDLNKAAKLAEKALDDPIRAAELYEQAGEWLKATRAYKRAERFADAAHCAEQGGALAKAADLYREAGDIDAEIRVRNSQGDYFRAGRLLFEQRRYEEALETLKRINSRDPIYSKSVELEGDIYRSMDKHEKAYGRYRSALGNRGSNDKKLPLHYKMARVLEAEKDWKDAIDHYGNVVDVDPDFEDAAERLETIRTGLRGGRRIEGAEEAAKDESLVVGAGEKSSGIPNNTDDGEDDAELRYEFLEELARGGMGVVYKARDTFLNRIVAVKLLGEDLRDNDTAVKYFLREARAAAALAHPNIVTIFDAGEQQGEYYIAMEYVDGETLKEKIKRGMIMDDETLRQVLIQSCKALDYAHDQDVVHRDVKSGNIMSKPDGTVKIMDFGLAKFLREYKQNHTQQVGTPYYMSPEQIIGENVDFRSDLYGLGCTAFECVTGRVPFTEGELAYHHVHSEPPSPREFNEGLSDEMEEIILRLLNKDPDDRYRSARELREVLE